MPVNGTLLHIETLIFDRLSMTIAEKAGDYQQLISSPLRKIVIRQCLQQLQETKQLTHFASIANTVGLADHLLQFIDELKQHRVSHQNFAAKCEDCKDQDVAIVFQKYQEYMFANQLVDRDGALWLAHWHLTHADLLSDIRLFLVDSFDHFTPLQAGLISAVAAQAQQTFITLPENSSGDGSHPEQQIRRFQQAREQIITSFQEKNLPLKKIENNAQKIKPKEKNAGSLQHLAKQLFKFSPLVIELDQNIQFIAAPTPLQELRVVLRRVKKLMLNESAKPSDILLVIPNPDEYLPYLDTVSREYSIPVQIRMGRSLLRIPVIHAIIRYLRLADDNFTKHELLNVLKSPYTRPPEMADEILTFLLEFGYLLQQRRGLKSWQEAFEKQPDLPEESEQQAKLRQNTIAFLESFLDPLLSLPRKTWVEQLKWMNQHFNLNETNPGSPQDIWRKIAIEESDTIWMQECKQNDQKAIRKLSQVLLSLNNFGISGTLSVIDELPHLMADQIIPTSPVDQMAIQVTNIPQARAWTPLHCYVLGMSESMFTPGVVASPLYLSSEREQLRKRGISLRKEHIHELQDGIFYQIVTSASQSLTLSRPYSDDFNLLPESQFWKAVTACFSRESVANNSTYVPVGKSLEPDEIASEGDAILAWLNSTGHEASQSVLPHRFFDTEESVKHLNLLEQGVEMEARRLSAAPHDHYSGRLSLPYINSEIEELFTEDYLWSISQLNEFARCGFHFFAKRLLRLEPWLEDPLDDEATLYGLLTHHLLKLTYEPFQQRRLPIIPEFLSVAHESLLKSIQQTFTEQNGWVANSISKNATLLPAIREYITVQLSALIEQDFTDSSYFDCAKINNRYVHFLEYDFIERINLGSEPQNNIRLHGIIDRIDRIGDDLIIIDYKSGSRNVTPTEIEEGLELQLPLYLLALQSGQDKRENTPKISAHYWHTRSLNRYKSIDCDEEGILAGIKYRVREMVHDARNANFSVNPTKLEQGRCVRYCPYFELCRITRTNTFKRE